MKLIKTAFIAVIVLLFSLTSSYGADDKIGVIDFQKVLRESDAGKSAKTDIESEGKRLEKKLKDEGEALEKMKKKLEAEIMVMSSEMRESKEREFRIKVDDFKVLQKKYANEFKTFEAKIIKQVQQEIFDLVEKIGKKGGYKLILERTAVLYYPDTIDITDILIKEYNASK
ncbi:putative outer membrane chaperone, Skp family [Desulfonema limicola]|uniref:Outer membrane chaperone, Skp family n=1 Tax=Desulfonema limicola TaxID=45656 RepID=A0A975GHV3_9BACT|nr:OmpH family outer membrane protein [Desulfonema limicola]QTA81941.1 putative outer membrane chaperone, Skp family [Desulfonema limicola]